MSAILNLYRLQQIDSQIDQARHRLQTITQTLEQDTVVKTARDRHAAAEAAKREAERSLRQIESDANAQKIKIEQAEASLYSGRVQNPKELQDLQNDVASLKRHLVTLEDRQLEAMLALETAQHEHLAAQSTLQNIEAQVLSQNATLSGERNTLLQQLSRLDVERQAVHATLPAPDLEQYEKLRRQRHGVAVTTVSEGACDSCGAPLPPGLHQRAKTLLTHCPGCGRILFNSR